MYSDINGLIGYITLFGFSAYTFHLRRTSRNQNGRPSQDPGLHMSRVSRVKGTGEAIQEDAFTK